MSSSNSWPNVSTIELDCVDLAHIVVLDFFLYNTPNRTRRLGQHMSCREGSNQSGVNKAFYLSMGDRGVRDRNFVETWIYIRITGGDAY